MKVYPDKLEAHLKKQRNSVYIVSGDEPLLVQESSDLIREILRGQGFVERDLFHVEANFDWTEVLYSVGSMSLFAEQKLIELRMASAKPGDKGSKALQELIEQLNDETVLLIVMPRVDAAAQRSKWFKAIEGAGVFTQVWPIDTKNYPAWLNRRLSQAGIKANREAVQVLADRTEGNLLAAIQEVARLRLAFEGQSIDATQVATSVADSARYDVFAWVDACLSGEIKRALRMTAGLKAEGVEVLFAVNMLSREIRALEAMRTALDAGESLPSVLKKARVWDKKAPPVKQALQSHSTNSLQQLQTDLGVIDRTVKGIHPGDPWRLLEQVVQRLAGLSIPRVSLPA